ncbi:MAG: hypothetical protein ACKO0Z_10545 [Betaproteobacteria bacterium]
MVTEFNVDAEQHGVDLLHHMPADDGVYMKEIRVPSGKEIFPHLHSFTHKSILATGDAVIRKHGSEDLIVSGPYVVTIERGVQHSVVALTDIVWFCVHATDEQDHKKIDHTLVGED